MLFILSSLVLGSPSCRNPSNQETDWWSVFKIPVLSDRIPNHVSGLGFFYNDNDHQLHESPSDLESISKNPVYYTLNQLYENNESLGYMLISDQPPHRTNNPSASYAHKKGALVYDKNSGFYFEHSVPRFPNDPKVISRYEYPSTGVTYGQSMLCVNLKPKDIEDWATGMLIEKGYVYSHNTPSYVESKFPSINNIIKKKWIKNIPTRVTTLNIGKHVFRLVSKSGKWGKDIYHDLLAPTFKANTKSETWSRGVGTLGSNCSGKYASYNIIDISFSGVRWKRTNDHSKWALVGDNVCIGGINRQESQFDRGGGAWCKSDPDFAKVMKDVIISTQAC